MVTQELIDIIALKFQQGENGKKIRESLISQGYEEIDINSAISEIQKAAFLQIPAYKFLYEKWHHWEARTANLSTVGVIGFFIVICIILLGIAGLLYMSTDPLGKQSIARDQERKAEVVQLQKALATYYATYRVFPAKLSELVPTYLKEQLTDPRSEESYEYILANDRRSYQVCMVFELQPKDCITVNSQELGLPDIVPQGNASEPGSTVYTLNGLVFLDSNQNGVKDGIAEAGQKGVSVRVSAGGGVNACETITDNIGNFRCTISTAGTYSLMLVLPPTYRASVTNPQAVTFGTGSSSTSVDVLLSIYAVGR